MDIQGPHAPYSTVSSALLQNVCIRKNVLLGTSSHTQQCAGALNKVATVRAVFLHWPDCSTL
jgi:hypothetical protein